MCSPILFLVFNRPETTVKVFAAIRTAAPQRLYIAADGPRNTKPDEAALTQQVRQIATQVDWPCEVFTLFRSENLGCKIAVAQGISWFFEHEEAGIILEDDCLPHPDFFDFCSVLLEKFALNTQIMMISGNQFDATTGQKSLTTYYPTVFTFIWGWATWRRAWHCFDMEMEALRNPNQVNEVWKSTLPDALARKYLLAIMLEVKAGKAITWDYQWLFTVLQQKGIVLVPKVNLVDNIGFGEAATHTNVSQWNLNTLTLPKPWVHLTEVEIPTGTENLVLFYKSYKSYWGLRLFFAHTALKRLFNLK